MVSEKYLLALTRCRESHRRIRGPRLGTLVSADAVFFATCPTPHPSYVRSKSLAECVLETSKPDSHSLIVIVIMTVTGASSGFGKALTEVVLQEGDIVVATLRNPSVLAHLTKDYPPSQLLLLTLDVTRPADIAAAFSRTEEIFGRLDVVFNNAGHGMFGEVEGTSDTDARALFDVNFWGVVGVSREAVRFFREVNPLGKGGVLFQHSSMMGFLGAPGISFYCAR